MTHRALAVADERGSRQWETTWRDDRSAPADVQRATASRLSGPASLKTIAESLDFARFEGVYHRADGEWTAYLACWLAIEQLLGKPLPEPRGDGALLAVRAGEASALRRWFRTAKGSVADAVLAGECSVTDARPALLEALDRRAGDRELVVGECPTDD